LGFVCDLGGWFVGSLCCWCWCAFCSAASPASAFWCWFASVAPVRGGTHFLCRRKESKQRKRAHTASSCCYPRALNVPALHTTTCSFAPVANASNQGLTRFKHLPNGPHHRAARAPLRQTVCRRSRGTGNLRDARAIAKTFRAPTQMSRQPTHSLPQRDRKGLARSASECVFEAGEALIRSVGNDSQSKRCRVKRGDVEGPWVTTRTGGVSGFLLPTFLCRGKEK